MTGTGRLGASRACVRRLPGCAAGSRTKVVRKATYKGMDITDKLRKIGLNEEQIFKTFGGYDYPTDQGIKWHFSEEQKKQLDAPVWE